MYNFGKRMVYMNSSKEYAKQLGLTEKDLEGYDEVEIE